MDYRKNNRIDPWDDRVYGTGKTEPPKNNSGIIALLSICIIFLSGIISVLSFMNIKLFHELQQVQSQTDSIPMAFSSMEEISPTGKNALPEAYYDSESTHIPMLGLAVEPISKFDQHYFQWPAGLLITRVDPGINAENQSVESGDILVSIDDTAISSQEELDSILASHKVGDTVQLGIYRDGSRYSLTITLSNKTN